MKKLVLIFILIPFLNIAQNSIPEVQKTEALIQIWGLMKYKHPEVSSGSYNWNQEFIDQYNSIQPIRTQQELNEYLLNWISNFEIDQLSTGKKLDIDAFKKNIDTSWIRRSGFSPNLVMKLEKIQENSDFDDHYTEVSNLTSHLSFEGDIESFKFNSQIKSHRLLFLADFWNAMKYWNVNLYLADHSWDEVLHTMTKIFLEAGSKEEFEIAKLNLFSSIDDSHSNYITSFLFKTKLKYHPPFGGKIVNDSLVVTKIYDLDLTKEAGIELGDVITKVEDKTIPEHLDEYSNLISASNPGYLLYWAEDQFVLSNKEDRIEIEMINKSNENIYREIKLYPMKEVSKFRIEKEIPTFYNDQNSNWKILKDNIAYLNLETTTKREIKQMFKEIESTDGLIIDLRNYPKHISESDITKYIYPKKVDFIKVLMPYSPGIGEYDGQSGLKLIKNPFSTGSNNPDYYDKPIVLMVDRNTGSKAEFFGMAIQNAPNCVSIGEQTMGCVMNIVEYPLVDGVKFRFTGMGAFYPDGSEAQRNGLRIDKMVMENALNYDPETYLNEARKVIQSKQSL